RLKLAQCVVDEGWPIRRAAERFQVSPTTAKRWADRYRQLGAAGMVDRSSRPHHSPNRTRPPVERKILHLRKTKRLGPAAIAGRLGMHASTVHKVLVRHGVPKLTCVDLATGQPIRKEEPRRYEHPAPGDLVHVDVKKLGRIPDAAAGAGTAEPTGGRNSRASAPSAAGPPARSGPAGADRRYDRSATPSGTSGWDVGNRYGCSRSRPALRPLWSYSEPGRTTAAGGRGPPARHDTAGRGPARRHRQASDRPGR
ncbi:MAG: helix-turn-helix domain-containing protein, partial [Dactylosporangium sp.]|nr:helix-turn-helix domain-containing protein [Dactylosporangium sp.]